MSDQNLSQQKPADTTASSLLQSLSPGISSVVMEKSNRLKESLESVLFAFNPWLPRINFSLKGYDFGIQIPVLPRMELIPLKVWHVPDIQPRAGGWTLGSLTSAGGAFPSGSVGSKVEQKLQFPSQSAKNLIAAFGSESTNNIGMTVFRSLGGDNDKDKLESLLLFQAVMQTGAAGERGVDLVLEALPKFLKETAPRLLAFACAKGVDIMDAEGTAKIQLSPFARSRGEVMIEDLKLSVAAATKRATDDTTGILTLTKRELIQAGRGQKDVKLIADDLDNWLLNQFPSFKMDTDVERSMRATAGIADAMTKSGERQELTLSQLIAMNQQTLDQLSKANELNERLVNERTVPLVPPVEQPTAQV